MNKIRAYVSGDATTFRASIGAAQTGRCATPEEAFRQGIELAKAQDARLAQLVEGRQLSRQVGIVFGAGIKQGYFREDSEC